MTLGCFGMIYPHLNFRHTISSMVKILPSMTYQINERVHGASLDRNTQIVIASEVRRSRKSAFGKISVSSEKRMPRQWTTEQVGDK